MMATKTALKLGEYVVTEAGFGADLGAEKFFDIKCRKGGLKPAAAVIVATVRALKMHGGVKKDDLKVENLDALRAGLANLKQHVENVKKFGVPPVVGINHFITDTEAEHKLIRDYCRESLKVEAVTCRHWADGSKGIEDLARAVVKIAESGAAEFKPLYPDAMPLWDKLRTIAKEVYRAEDVTDAGGVRNSFRDYEERGLGHLPICVAKTQYSFSTNPDAKGAPTGHTIPVREVRLSNGAEFLVAICGEIMTMPGLPRAPSAHNIRLDAQGRIEGLF